MTALGYSELLKRMTGIDKEHLETPFVILNKSNTTKNRLRILKTLANHDKATIGFLLKSLKQNRGGGSYLTVKKYFLALEKQGLLMRISNNRREYWSFSDKFSDLKRFILK